MCSRFGPDDEAESEDERLHHEQRDRVGHRRATITAQRDETEDENGNGNGHGNGEGGEESEGPAE